METREQEAAREVAKERVDRVRRAMGADLSAAFAKALYEEVGFAAWPGDVDPVTCAALDLALDGVIYQLMENAEGVIEQTAVQLAASALGEARTSGGSWWEGLPEDIKEGYREKAREILHAQDDGEEGS